MFYKENNLKNTELGEIPKDWEIIKFEGLCTEIKSGGTPLTSRQDFYNGNIPFVKIEDITFAKKYLITTKYFLTEKGLENSNAWVVPPKSLLLAIYGSLGVPAINTKEVTTNQAILGIIPNTKTTVEFLYYLFSNTDLKRYAKQTTQANLTAKIIKNILIPLPILHEQQKIADILSDIDISIQKTDELIAETNRLKKGLLEQLFTKGLNHKKFKKVEIRTGIYNLPEEWRISNLSKTSTIKGRIGWQGLTRKEYLKEGEYLLVTGTDFERGRIVWNRCVYVSEGRYMQDTNIQLKEGDILITKDGTIGKIAYVDKLPQRATLNSGIFVVRPVNSAYDPSYMFWIMQSRFFNVFMNILKAGSTISHLYQRDFVNFEFPIPPLEEQQKIVKILSTVDHKLDLERKEKRHLERVKSGLMDKLLSGRVRVK